MTPSDRGKKDREREGGMRVCGRERGKERGRQERKEERKCGRKLIQKVFVNKRNRKCAKHGGVS